MLRVKQESEKAGLKTQHSILNSSWKRRVRSQNGGKTAARSPPARLRPSPPPPGGGGIRGRAGGCWVVAGKVGGLARWERGGRVDRVGRPALCVETGAGRGRGAGLGALLGASRQPCRLPGLHKWFLGGAVWLGRLRERSWLAGRAASDARPRAAWRASARAVGRRRPSRECRKWPRSLRPSALGDVLPTRF